MADVGREDHKRQPHHGRRGTPAGQPRVPATDGASSARLMHSSGRRPVRRPPRTGAPMLPARTLLGLARRSCSTLVLLAAMPNRAGRNDAVVTLDAAQSWLAGWLAALIQRERRRFARWRRATQRQSRRGRDLSVRPTRTTWRCWRRWRCAGLHGGGAPSGAQATSMSISSADGRGFDGVRTHARTSRDPSRRRTGAATLVASAPGRIGPSDLSLVPRSTRVHSCRMPVPPAWSRPRSPPGPGSVTRLRSGSRG